MEIIVVANRCTDKTAAIARHYGARVLSNDEKCIASIRNTGVKAANGEIVVTIDADSISFEDMDFAKRLKKLGAGRGQK